MGGSDSRNGVNLKTKLVPLWSLWTERSDGWMPLLSDHNVATAECCCGVLKPAKSAAVSWRRSTADYDSNCDQHCDQELDSNWSQTCWGGLPVIVRFYLESRVEYAAKFSAHAWKVCIRAIVSWVRIPLSPPFLKDLLNYKLILM